MKNTPIYKAIQNSSTQILGHRGARGEVLENSKKSFKYLQLLSNQETKFHNRQTKSNIVGVEFDVQLTADNHLIVFHDDNLTRLYNKQSLVSHLTLAELMRISKTAKQPILTLEQMPELLHNYQHVELEIKTHQRTNYHNLLTSLEKSLNTLNFSAIPITLTTFDTYLLNLLKNHSFLSSLKRGLLIEVNQNKCLNEQNHQRVERNKLPLSCHCDLYDIPYLAHKLNCQQIGLYYPLFDEKIVQLCCRYNLKTTAWTVNNEDDVINLIELGINYIITDYPTKMIKYL